jgi:hypothetical protein
VLPVNDSIKEFFYALSPELELELEILQKLDLDKKVKKNDLIDQIYEDNYFK